MWVGKAHFRTAMSEEGNRTDHSVEVWMTRSNPAAERCTGLYSTDQKSGQRTQALGGGQRRKSHPDSFKLRSKKIATAGNNQTGQDCHRGHEEKGIRGKNLERKEKTTRQVWAIWLRALGGEGGENGGGGKYQYKRKASSVMNEAKPF